eukprot:1771108-Pleurochrysis_carterae.AAC.1
MTKHPVPKHCTTKLNLRIAKLIKDRFSSMNVFDRPWHVHTIHVQPFPLVRLKPMNSRLE